MNTDRWADLKAFVAEWYRPREASDGSTEEEIVEAETRLGIRLPEALRDIHTMFGKNEHLRAAQDWLNPLYELEIVNGVLPISAENQGVVYFGILLGSDPDNPMVVIDDASFEEPDTWRQLDGSLQDFLTSLISNNLFIGLEYPKAYNYSEPIVRALYSEGELISLGTKDCFSNQYYRWHGRLVCCNGERIVQATARTKESLEEFISIVGGEWRIQEHHG